jgi:predicted nucleic acid-binding protein
MRRQRSEDEADLAAARLKKCELVPLDERLALSAADLSLKHGLAMADAVVYATARHHNATLITMDGDFEGLPGAEVVAGE